MLDSAVNVYQGVIAAIGLPGLLMLIIYVSAIPLIRAYKVLSAAYQNKQKQAWLDKKQKQLFKQETSAQLYSQEGEKLVHHGATLTHFGGQYLLTLYTREDDTETMTATLETKSIEELADYLRHETKFVLADFKV